MLKKLLIPLLLLLLCFLAPSIADSKKDFIAVYTTPGALRDVWQETNERADYLYTATDWRDFDQFLRVTKFLAHGRHIILDIEVHGDDDGFYIQYKDCFDHLITHRATAGFIVSELKNNFKTNELDVLTEACYSGRAYHNTLRSFTGVPNEGDELVSFKGTVDFPIWGVGAAHIGYADLVYISFIHHFNRTYCDLRQFEQGVLPPKEEGDAADNKVAQSYDALQYMIEQKLI